MVDQTWGWKPWLDDIRELRLRVVDTPRTKVLTEKKYREWAWHLMFIFPLKHLPIQKAQHRIQKVRDTCIFNNWWDKNWSLGLAQGEEIMVNSELSDGNPQRIHSMSKNITLHKTRLKSAQLQIILSCSRSNEELQ